MISNLSIMSIFSAFFAGILSFLSPCVLPLIPSYLVFITGVSLNQILSNFDNSKKFIYSNSISFILGFTSIFVLLGALAGYLGSLLIQYKSYLRISGGFLVILFGLFVLGILDFGILKKEYRYIILNKPVGIIGAFLVGASFAAGWIPCVGPILGSILVLAASTQTIFSGIFLLFIFSIGFAIPFLLMSIFVKTIFDRIKFLNKYIPLISKLTGLLLILIGFLLLLDLLKM